MTDPAAPAPGVGRITFADLWSACATEASTASLWADLLAREEAAALAAGAKATAAHKRAAVAHQRRRAAVFEKLADIADRCGRDPTIIERLTDMAAAEREAAADALPDAEGGEE